MRRRRVHRVDETRKVHVLGQQHPGTPGPLAALVNQQGDTITIGQALGNHQDIEDRQTVECRSSFRQGPD